jgi:DNA-3-methyladenine glycosylase I
MLTGPKATSRCPWAGTDPLYVGYHDREWGVGSRDPGHLFEMLLLEGAQAGLSWITILRKRENYRKAFDLFDPEAIARYTPARVNRLLADPGIVRNRLKVEGAIRNARAFLQLREQDDLVAWFWQFTGGRPLVNRWKTIAEVPARTSESDGMSRALKRRGFTFVGSTICYSFMQATGMVNDHLTTCFRHRQVGRQSSVPAVRPATRRPSAG